MISLVHLFLFFFGLASGSFINVLVYRLNHDLSPFKGRSFCPKCQKKILWYDNLPLLSFVLLKGQCRFCHSPISWQYPFVELATGILFLTLAAFWQSFGFAGGLFGLVYFLFIGSVLMTVFISDFRYTTIPDGAIWVGITATVVAILTGVLEVNLITGLFSGLGTAGFFLFLVFITRGKGMGLGDVKLAGLMGLVLGYPLILIALFFAFLTGAALGVILILSRKKRFGEHLPFGPFLVTGTLIALFWGEKIWTQISKGLLW